MDVPTHLRYSTSRITESLSSFLRTNVALTSQLGDLQSAHDDTAVGEDEVLRRIEEARAAGEKAGIRLMEKEMAMVSGKLKEAINEGTKKDEEIARYVALLGETNGVLADTRGECEELKGECVVLRNENGEHLKSIAAMELFKAISEKLQISLDRETETCEELRKRLKEITDAHADASQNSGKQEQLLAEMEKRWRKALDDAQSKADKEKDELTKQMKSRDRTIRELEAATRANNEQNSSLMEKNDKLLQAYNREKKGRESVETNWKDDVEKLNGQMVEMSTSHEREIELLKITIGELEEEIRRLSANQKDPVPQGSKFKMFVDLKSQNNKLSKALEKERSVKAKLNSGGMANVRRAGRSSFDKQTSQFGGEQEGRVEAAERTASAPRGRGKFPEEVSMFAQSQAGR